MDWFSGPRHEPFQIGAGPTATLLLHGFMGTPAELRPMAEAMTGAGLTLRGIQLPGFGRDLHRLGSVTQVDWIRSALDAWDDLAIHHPRVDLLGYSMGGAVALHLAALRPVSRLTLVAPLWRLLSGDPRGLAMPLLPLAKHVVREVRPFDNTDFSDPDVRQFLQEMIPSIDLDDPAAQRALRSQAVLPTRTLDELRKLAAVSADLARRASMPVLVVQGTDDHVVRARDTRRLVGRFSGPFAYHQIPGDHLLLDPARPSWPDVRDLVVSFSSRSMTLSRGMI